MIPRDSSPRSHAAFTRTELIFVIFAAVVIICLATACISRTRRQNDLARCKDNLKNIALALNLWVEDNDLNCLPWHRDNPAVSTNELRRNECWFHLASVSNQLGSPKLLVCPADRSARIAKTWNTDPKNGFGGAKYRDQACSYAIALDGVGSFTGPPPPVEVDNAPVVFIDRHLQGKSKPEQCTHTGIASTSFERPFVLWWRAEMHGSETGNVALLDGSAETRSGSTVEQLLLANLYSPYRSSHLLFPKRQ